MSNPPRPSRREEFEFALICALPLEYNAVSLLFDKFWDEDGDHYGRAAGDPNTYTTGCIGKYNVVLALLPYMGKVNAASATASIRSSYTGLKLALPVGICGGVPKKGEGEDDEVLLGDVVISKTIVQYDFGRRYPNMLARKDTVDDNLGRPNKDIRSLLATLETELGLERLQQRTAHHLKMLQASAIRKKRRVKYNYPGSAEDKLFEPSYRHKHHGAPTCICKDCNEKSDPVCAEAPSSSCADLQCNETHLVPRERLKAKRQLEQNSDSNVQEPAIHIGRIASGDTVMKSGKDRDSIAKEDGVIAFEMEGAGVWDEVPCVVVKGVCDYADCHKNKRWQDFAAATAAAAMKALLECYIQTDKLPGPAIPDARHARRDVVREDCGAPDDSPPLPAQELYDPQFSLHRVKDQEAPLGPIIKVFETGYHIDAPSKQITPRLYKEREANRESFEAEPYTSTHEEVEGVRQPKVGTHETVLDAGNAHSQGTSVLEIADSIFNTGNYKAAEKVYRQAMEEQTKSLGLEHPETLRSIQGVAISLYKQKSYKDAEGMYRLVMNKRGKALGQEHLDTLDAVYGLGRSLYAQTKYGAAELKLRQAEEGRRKVLEQDHADTLDASYWLGCSLYGQKKYGAAELMFRRAVEGRKKVLGRQHTHTLDAVYWLGCSLYFQKKRKEAESMLRWVVEGRNTVDG